MSEHKLCQHCNLPFGPRLNPRREKPNEYQRRKFCSEHCRVAAQRAPRQPTGPEPTTLHGSPKPEPVPSAYRKRKRKRRAPPELRRDLVRAFAAHPELLEVWGDNSTDASSIEFIGAKVGMGVEGAYVGSNR